MNKIVVLCWVIAMLVVGTLDITSSIEASQRPSTEEKNLLMRALIDVFGAAPALFVFGSIIKIGFIALVLVGMHHMFKLAHTIQENWIRKFMQACLYGTMALLVGLQIIVTIGNYNL